MHRCPGRLPGCLGSVGDAMLACKPCWFALPMPHRNLVWAGWRNRAADGGAGHRKAVQEACDWYRERRPT